jgi:hypothetical protein
VRIVRKFPGVTLDWLFLGRPEGLTVEIARALSEPSKGNDAHGDSQAVSSKSLESRHYVDAEPDNAPASTT